MKNKVGLSPKNLLERANVFKRRFLNIYTPLHITLWCMMRSGAFYPLLAWDVAASGCFLYFVVKTDGRD
jgi:hypothetical protein